MWFYFWVLNSIPIMYTFSILWIPHRLLHYSCVVTLLRSDSFYLILYSKLFSSTHEPLYIRFLLSFFLSLYLYLFSWRQFYYVAHAGLELVTILLPQLPSTGTTGMYHHDWLPVNFWISLDYKKNCLQELILAKGQEATFNRITKDDSSVLHILKS